MNALVLAGFLLAAAGPAPKRMPVYIPKADASEDVLVCYRAAKGLKCVGFDRFMTYWTGRKDAETEQKQEKEAAPSNPNLYEL